MNYSSNIRFFLYFFLLKKHTFFCEIYTKLPLILDALLVQHQVYIDRYKPLKTGSWRKVHPRLIAHFSLLLSNSTLLRTFPVFRGVCGDLCTCIPYIHLYALTYTRAPSGRYCSYVFSSFCRNGKKKKCLSLTHKCLAYCISTLIN
jgi:hypothetical protein